MNKPQAADPSVPAWSVTATPTRTAAQRLQAFANSRAGLAVLFVFLFLAAWIPRTLELDRFVTADEHRWITRSANFAYAVKHGDLLHTYQREHPAVTTTWLGALGVITAMPDYPDKAPGYFDAMREDWGIWVRANTDVEPITMLAWGRIYTVFVISLVLALAFFPLRRLFGTPAAVVANLFVAWSPMAIAFSRQVQPDGLHAMFMYAALVFFLGWLYAGLRWRDLVASGILMGLGWLTKTPVLFLAPIGGVLIALEWWRRRKAEANGPLVRQLLGSYVLWGVIASATFFLLWPALWVDPIGIFVKMYTEMTEYIGGHSNPNFFMGQILHDPGPLFYPVAYYFRTTPAALIGIIAMIVALWKRRPPLATPTEARAGWGLLIFAVLFALLMTAPAKKFDRYLMPTFLVLDVVAGLGWTAFALWAYRAVAARTKSSWQPLAAGFGAAILGVVLLHGLLNVPYYPYYLTYYNPLAGGPRAAERDMFVGWGEGLEEAGHWLDQQPDPDQEARGRLVCDGPALVLLPRRIRRRDLRLAHAVAGRRLCRHLHQPGAARHSDQGSGGLFRPPDTRLHVYAQRAGHGQGLRHAGDHCEALRRCRRAAGSARRHSVAADDADGTAHAASARRWGRCSRSSWPGTGRLTAHAVSHCD